MSVLFVSDLHLDAGSPEIGDQFIRFLRQRASNADALYILGDLFESWVGDDDPQPERERLATELTALKRAGVDCFFMHGNRDFLVGEQFAAAAGVELLDEEVVLDVSGTKVLIMHGDSLCTDDVEYQAFRATVRDAAWQENFLQLPLQQRLALAVQAREHSQARNATAADFIMDVNQNAVAEALRRHGVHHLLHGHTHRPDVHRFELDKQPAVRMVLGDWYDQGSVLEWDAAGPRLESLPRQA
ncbi:MAG: UDP-2,3-diacylglucosamine diphosphatase [Gammaproteobacteria bacterium]|nr:UDP-2,3-diacylglucosamine diphosphatase [Gammaproteobacteria bacterium]NNF62058.1 UDP-2,3-diacylglucosamine diphosphatase [Gammaproteobacteria bacterium]NNM20669.1 UDP-2,3-diacylglucosamine diphosphatase [Gammaproteobacteria bacterium]